MMELLLIIKQEEVQIAPFNITIFLIGGILITLFIISALLLAKAIKSYMVSRVEEYKLMVINYEQILDQALKAIGEFDKRAKDLNKVTECFISKMQEFKQSDVYKHFEKTKD